ncbi:glycerol-3-phosphate acyltransferase [Methylogaea oryzae]|uniref:Glycerol-3-phosphate acyltransferase n=2 Tax=Methylogaea oryzae TaxID=1295382 RepID=A0A8D5AL87_9GAMM|nr:glycerol-3-phosphate 1-O-acyltransferase PlsY [Methylogaea oryzae]BBL72584.1 glycerol-3-phosphate acyltransferase [Methylogaea oryzae]
MMWQWALVPLAYLMGSVSSAVVVCRAMGLPDPRAEGSKNPGATNVLRIGGKKAAAITLFGDVLKGVLPVVLGKALGVEPMLLAMIGLAAFLGHLFPVFFGFQGGKGVATAVGVLAAFSWQVGLALLGTWLAMAAISRISSLSALTASVLAPFYVWWLSGDMAMTATAGLLSVLLVWRHKGNIQRILSGTESRIGQKKKAA